MSSAITPPRRGSAEFRKGHFNNRGSQASPIHSVSKSPHKKHNQWHSQKMETSVISRIAVNDPDPANGKYSASPRTVSKALFSPKYEKKNLTDNDNEFGSNVAASPKKNNVAKLDQECQLAVRDVRNSVWELARDENDGFLFMKYAREITDEYFANKQPCLPKKKNDDFEYTLVLDLDETLVHCSIDACPNPDLTFPVSFNNEQYMVYMKQRPYFHKFLDQVSKMFEVVIFTASQRCYAEKLLSEVDPNKKYIKYQLYRDHCIHVDGNFVKDLRVLGRDLKKTIIIDNSPPAFTYQVNNGIPIVSWFDEKSDTELLKMIPILQKLKEQDDVRPHIKAWFGLKDLLKGVRM